MGTNRMEGFLPLEAIPLRRWLWSAGEIIKPRPEDMEALLSAAAGPAVQDKAGEAMATPTTVQLCRLLASAEREDGKKDALASLEEVAAHLAKACEGFVQAVGRLAGDSEEEWLREEMKSLAESLILSGRKVMLVTQKLHLQPEYQCHQEELVIMALQIVVDTTKVLLLEDTAMLRKVLKAVDRCLTCLDRLEATEDATSLRGSFADLGAELLLLGRLTARGRGDQRLGRARHLLRRSVPALLAAARGHLRPPRDAQLAASRRRIFGQTREILGELRAGLQAGAATSGARTGNGSPARHLLAAPGLPRSGRLDAPLATAVWHCLRLAAGFAPRERLRVVSLCGRLLELRRDGDRRLDGIHGPPAGDRLLDGIHGPPAGDRRLDRIHWPPAGDRLLDGIHGPPAGDRLLDGIHGPPAGDRLLDGIHGPPVGDRLLDRIHWPPAGDRLLDGIHGPPAGDRLLDRIHGPPAGDRLLDGIHGPPAGDRLLDRIHGPPAGDRLLDGIHGPPAGDRRLDRIHGPPAGDRLLDGIHGPPVGDRLLDGIHGPPAGDRLLDGIHGPPVGDRRLDRIHEPLAGDRRLDRIHGPLAGDRRLDEIHGPSAVSQETPAECEALRVEADTLSESIHAELLHQILDTFTDTHSPLQRLVQAALAAFTGSSTSDGNALQKSLQLLLDAFLDQANSMARVAHLVLLCCPQQQTGRDLEAAVAGLWGLVIRVKQLFQQSPPECGLDWSPASMKALLEAWTHTSELLSSCFDDVLNIPEFLTVSIQEMIRHLDFLTWALRSGDSREFSRPVMYLLGRATHIVQVMSRYMSQDRDPIFRNGLKVLILQLERSSLLLGAATERSKSGDSSQDSDAILTLAKHLVYSAQQVREGLDGTNHPDILSPLRGQVHRFTLAKRQPYFILPSLQHYMAPEMKCQRVSGLDKRDPNGQPSFWMIPDTCIQARCSPLPASSKLILTVENQGHGTVTSARISMSDQDETVEAGQKALAAEQLPASERMTELHELSTPAFSNTDLARDHSTSAGHLELALQLSERTRESRQGLVARAGDWYALCQQLFCHNPTADLTGSMAVFMELQQSLASMVQLAAKGGPVNLDKDADCLWHSGVLFQMQGQLEKAEIHAKQLLDKVLSSNGLRASKLWEGTIKSGCLQWSVAVQELIQFMERLIRRQGLFLLPLRQAVKDQQGLQEGLDQAVDVSRRLKEAAELSSFLCEDEQVKGEVSSLCREVHVLRDALLDVARILASSLKPSPSLSTRFELLCLELTLRAKALTGHLSRINGEYERAFQDAVCPILCVCKNPQTRAEGPLKNMLSGIQAVQGILADQESEPCQEDLVVALEGILILTKEVAQRVPVLQEHPEEWRLHVLDWLRWEWAAKAHHAVAQLQAWKGGHTKAYRLLVQCLDPRGKPPRAMGEDPVQFLLHCEQSAAETPAGDSVNSQSSLQSSVRTCPDELTTTGTTAVDMSMVGTAVDMSMQLVGSSSLSPGYPSRRQQAGTDQSAPEDGRAGGEDRVTKLTQEMAQEVFLMTQSLRKRGRILTKDQLITSARKIAAAGETLTRLLGIIAKSCVDDRCSRELALALEQIGTRSSQLRMLSRVKASLARSKSEEELLAENAQQLLRAVAGAARAAEAAGLRGLRQPSADPEELELAAFCTRWRRKLQRHRLQESTRADCDELGLRKTATESLPALLALGPETV